jgi:glycosyltransferase involved in cell wall biosynthesis
VSADAQIFLNDIDRDHAMHSLGVSGETSVVLPNGVPDALLDQPRLLPAMNWAPISLAFIGSWIPRKGTRALVAMASALKAKDVPFVLRLFGTGVDADVVQNEFPADLREKITVRPRYEPEQLSSLLARSEVLLHPSWTEGFSLALVEGMACGLAPIATRSGGATTVVRDGENGVLLDEGSGIALADAVAGLSGDRVRLSRMRMAAQDSMKALRWDTVAAQTIDVYSAALARRRGDAA